MSETACPYCGGAIPSPGRKHHYCTQCGTPHHSDCWEEHRGCSVSGCAASAAGEASTPTAIPASEAVAAEPEIPPQEEPALDGLESPAGDTPPLPPPMDDPPRPAPLTASPAVGGEAPPVPYYSIPQPAPSGPLPKSRVGYILLGVFLGALGVHNFYAGYVGKGIAQLCISLLSCFVLSPASYIWAIVEVCITERDATGVPMT